FILGDYSAATLDRAMVSLAHHGGHVSAAPLNALNPFKTLSAYRFKVMYVHLTNVYDNLPFDDMVRRDGRLYLVEVRAYLSGAAESFANTLPLLHPRGYLQVQDIFVEHMDEYRKGFRGPGKLDGSLVTWVNGALLRAVGARAGYDVHFAPFPYRPGTKTTVMYTTQRP